MFSIEIKGLDELALHLEELQQAAGALDGDICEVTFNPADASDVARAIADVEMTIDARIAKWKHNQAVVDLAHTLKGRYRSEIMERVAKSLNG
jgi:hypothetical protein